MATKLSKWFKLNLRKDSNTYKNQGFLLGLS